MARKSSRRLVIDASVARAAGGEDATFPTPKHCRDLLTATLTICHRVVMTEAIVAEWKEHQSRFARAWRVSMEAKKKVDRPPVAANEPLRERVMQAAAGENDADAMLKDFHLVEAALATDRVIISLDDSVRRLLSGASISVGELRQLLWANPADEDEDLLTWLTAGAKNEKERRLGYTPTSED